MKIEGEGDIAALCLRLLGQTPGVTVAEGTRQKCQRQVRSRFGGQIA